MMRPLLLGLFWGGALFLLFQPSPPASWLPAALRSGNLPSSTWGLSELVDLKIRLPLLGRQGVGLRAERAEPQPRGLGPLQAPGVPGGFLFQRVRVEVGGLRFESQEGEWKSPGLLLQGRVRVSRGGRLLLESPSLFLSSERDWISSRDLVLLAGGEEGGKKARLELGLPSSSLK